MMTYADKLVSGHGKLVVSSAQTANGERYGGVVRGRTDRCHPASSVEGGSGTEPSQRKRVSPTARMPEVSAE